MSSEGCEGEAAMVRLQQALALSETVSWRQLETKQVRKCGQSHLQLQRKLSPETRRGIQEKQRCRLLFTTSKHYLQLSVGLLNEQSLERWWAGCALRSTASCLPHLSFCAPPLALNMGYHHGSKAVRQIKLEGG